MRKIKVISPNKTIEFETSVDNWGQLANEIQHQHLIPLNNMVCICAQNKMRFELAQTKLPIFEGKVDLTILIVQGKSEKGGYKEIKAKIKELWKKFSMLKLRMLIL